MARETKIALVINDCLAMWQRLNVAAFLAGGLAGRLPDIVGADYATSDGQPFGPLIAEPVLVFAAGDDALRATLRAAIARNLRTSIYTMGLFKTSNDHDNRAVVAALSVPMCDLAGLIMHGRRQDVDRAIKGLALHP